MHIACLSTVSAKPSAYQDILSKHNSLVQGLQVGLRLSDVREAVDYLTNNKNELQILFGGLSDQQLLSPHTFLAPLNEFGVAMQQFLSFITVDFASSGKRPARQSKFNAAVLKVYRERFRAMATTLRDMMQRLWPILEPRAQRGDRIVLLQVRNVLEELLQAEALLSSRDEIAQDTLQLLNRLARFVSSNLLSPLVERVNRLLAWIARYLSCGLTVDAATKPAVRTANIQLGMYGMEFYLGSMPVAFLGSTVDSNRAMFQLWLAGFRRALRLYSSDSHNQQLSNELQLRKQPDLFQFEPGLFADFLDEADLLLFAETLIMHYLSGPAVAELGRMQLLKEQLTHADFVQDPEIVQAQNDASQVAEVADTVQHPLAGALRASRLRFDSALDKTKQMLTNLLPKEDENSPEFRERQWHRSGEVAAYFASGQLPTSVPDFASRPEMQELADAYLAMAQVAFDIEVDLADDFWEETGAQPPESLLRQLEHRADLLEAGVTEVGAPSRSPAPSRGRSPVRPMPNRPAPPGQQPAPVPAVQPDPQRGRSPRRPLSAAQQQAQQDAAANLQGSMVLTEGLVSRLTSATSSVFKFAASSFSRLNIQNKTLVVCSIIALVQYASPATQYAIATVKLWGGDIDAIAQMQQDNADMAEANLIYEQHYNAAYNRLAPNSGVVEIDRVASLQENFGFAFAVDRNLLDSNGNVDLALAEFIRQAAQNPNTQQAVDALLNRDLSPASLMNLERPLILSSLRSRPGFPLEQDPIISIANFIVTTRQRPDVSWANQAVSRLRAQLKLVQQNADLTARDRELLRIFGIRAKTAVGVMIGARKDIYDDYEIGPMPEAAPPIPSYPFDPESGVAFTPPSLGPLPESAKVRTNPELRRRVDEILHEANSTGFWAFVTNEQALLYTLSFMAVLLVWFFMHGKVRNPNSGNYVWDLSRGIPIYILSTMLLIGIPEYGDFGTAVTLTGAVAEGLANGWISYLTTFNRASLLYNIVTGIRYLFPGWALRGFLYAVAAKSSYDALVDGIIRETLGFFRGQAGATGSLQLTRAIEASPPAQQMELFQFNQQNMNQLGQAANMILTELQQLNRNQQQLNRNQQQMLSEMQNFRLQSRSSVPVPGAYRLPLLTQEDIDSGSHRLFGH